MPASRHSGLRKKLLWFVLLWAAGVAAVLLLGLTIRLLMPGG